MNIVQISAVSLPPIVIFVYYVVDFVVSGGVSCPPNGVRMVTDQQTRSLSKFGYRSYHSTPRRHSTSQILIYLF